MQINIDKKTGILSGVIIALVAVVISMAFISKDDDGYFGMGHSPNMGSDNSTSMGQLSGDEVMFLQGMIPHHQQAVDMSNLALTTSKDAELIALATAIRDGQADEIIQMKKWLGEAGESTMMGHSMGGSMSGMMSETEMSALESATGAEFDLLWLKGMTAHHDGAIEMAKVIQNAKNPEIKKFGEAIVYAQTAQNKQMELMLKRIGQHNFLLISFF